MSEARTPQPAAAEKYRKVPGRAAGFLGVSRLWLGSDHLLSVSTMAGVERYRRFYYKDIEAFVVQRTRRRLVLNIVFCILTGMVAGLVAFFGWISSNLSARTGGNNAPEALIVGLIIVVGLGLLLILTNTLRGQTCTFHIQTASGLTALDGPVRTRAARRLIARLAPVIEDAQASA